MQLTEEILDYDQLVSDFHESLVTTLRLHGSELGFLTLWVPDDDIVRSLQSLVESASLSEVSAVSIKISRQTFRSEMLEPVRKEISKIGTISIEESEESYLLKISDILAKGSDREISDAPSHEKVSYIKYIYGGEYRSETPPDYLTVLKSKASQTDTDTSPNSVESAGDVFAVEEDGVKFSINVDPESRIIQKAHFSGASEDAVIGALNMLSENMVGYSVLEAGEHGASRVLAALQSETTGARPVAGIVLPFNAGPEIGLMHRISQKLLEVTGPHKDPTTKLNASAYCVAPSAEWEGLSNSDRQTKIRASISTFEEENGHLPDSVGFVGLEQDISGWYVRVVIQISEEIPVEKRPSLIRKLEPYLKTKLESTLQVYYQERADENKIRRL